MQFVKKVTTRAHNMIGFLLFKLLTAGKCGLYHYFSQKSAFEPWRNVAKVVEVKSKFRKQLMK